MLKLKVNYNVYNRPVRFDGVIYPCVGVIDVSDKLNLCDKEDAVTAVFGNDEDEVICKAEAELRDMLPERYKNIGLILEPICTEGRPDAKPIPFERFIMDPDRYYLAD